MDFSILCSMFVIGLATAMLLFMISSGLTLVFGVLGIINFAHGALYMLGAYLALTFVFLLKPLVGAFWISFVLASLVVAFLGIVIEFFCLRRVYKADHIYQLLLTYALVMIIDGLVKVIWGLNPHSISEPAILSGSLLIFGRLVPTYALFIIFSGLMLSFFLRIFLLNSNYGKLIRAAASDADMTNALGVNVPFIFTGVFCLGSLLAAIGGILAGPLRVVSPNMGDLIIIECFAVVVIGGMGSLQGAFIGSLLIGMGDSFVTYFFPRLSMVLVYMLMAAVLVVKPRGLFGVDD